MFQARRPLSTLALTALVATAVVGCAPAPAAPAPPPPSAAPTRQIVFPLAVSVKYSDTFGAGRSGGRSHEGQDLMAPKGTPAVAAASGTVTMVRHSPAGLSGNMLRITDAEGWQYVYIHLNNDTPGTDDGANVFEEAFAPGMRQGQKVVAGEPIGFVGDSGNAESTGAHLHFEILEPGVGAVNAYSSLRASTVAPLSSAQVEAAAPIGIVDVLAPDVAGAVRVAGWSLDRVSNDQTPISVYVDGNPVRTFTSDGPRPDIEAAFPGRGAAHGFDAVVSGIAPGAHRICVVAHNSGEGGGSAKLRCEQVVVG